MSDRRAMAEDDLQRQLLDDCERGDLKSIKNLVEKKAVDPNKIIDKRCYYECRGYWTDGWTPLHFASV